MIWPILITAACAVVLAVSLIVRRGARLEGDWYGGDEEVFRMTAWATAVVLVIVWATWALLA